MDRQKFLIEKIKELVETREKLEREGKPFNVETLANYFGMIIDEYLEKRLGEAKKVLDIHPEISFPLKLDQGSKIIFHTRDAHYVAIIEDIKTEEGEYVH